MTHHGFGRGLAGATGLVALVAFMACSDSDPVAVASGGAAGTSFGGAAGSSAGGTAGDSSSAGGGASSGIVAVPAKVETVKMEGDFDDPAIWVHPKDPTKSLILAANKLEANGGIYVFDLTGALVQSLPDMQPNNVDLRHGFDLGGEKFALVTSGDRRNRTFAVHKVAEDGTVSSARADAGIAMEEEPYGSCMYLSKKTGKLYGFVDSKSGRVWQYELTDAGDGTVSGTVVRELKVDTQPEGCVADDELGRFYLGEEKKGIWRFDAEPGGSKEPVLVDQIGSGGNIVTADVEGLTIYRGADGKGYLILSSQGENSYLLYERTGDNRFVGRFRIDGGAIDGTRETDGIDVISTGLGDAFPSGVFIAHDDFNEGFTKNLKLVDWRDIAKSFDPPLLVVTGETRRP